MSLPNEVLKAGFLPSELGRSFFAEDTLVKPCDRCGFADDIPAGETTCDSCVSAINSGWEF
jgi:hypothetical protein